MDILQPEPADRRHHPFLKSRLVEHHLQIAPHFVMESTCSLAAAYPHKTWVEHIDWLYPLFDERLESVAGACAYPTVPASDSR